MADCSKKILDFTLGDAYDCFVNAEDWKVVAGNSRRMWASFAGTTIGEWLGIIMAFAVLPAQLASYILPPVFLFRFIGRYRTPTRIASATDKRKQVAWGLYLIASGLLKLAMGEIGACSIRGHGRQPAAASFLRSVRHGGSKT